MAIKLNTLKKSNKEIKGVKSKGSVSLDFKIKGVSIT